MFRFVKEIPNVLKRFFKNFINCFSPSTFAEILKYFVSLFLPHKRFCMQSVTGSKVVDAEYQRLQYAFSESNWDHDKVNNLRLDYIMRSPATSPTTQGILSIDDTSAKKAKGTKHTEGAKVQYCGSEGRLANCNVFVYSGYTDPNRHFLIDSEPYIPEEQCDKIEPAVEFKSKIRLCMDLIDKAIERGIPFSYICIDNWYLCKKVILHIIEGHSKHFISELAANNKISIGGRWVAADGLVKAIPPNEWEVVTVSDASNNSRSFYQTSVITKVKGFPGRYKIIFAQEFEPFTGKYIGKPFILITDHLSALTGLILQNYLLRWGIERCFEEAKDFCYLDHYQVRKIDRIMKHLTLSVLAHTFLYTAGKLGSFSKSLGNILKIQAVAVKQELKTFGDLLRAVRTLIVQKNQRLLAYDTTFPASIFRGL